MNSNCLSSSSSLIPTFLVIFLTTTCVSTSNGGNESDHLALLSFKSMITYDPYGTLRSWNSSVHFCDWGGVSCGKRHRRVTVVQLESRGLAGTLSPHVGNLSFLRVFGFWNNSLQGTIPHEIGGLSRLRVLDLGGNKLSGVIPANLSSCSNLEIVSVILNKLVGSIPKDISFLSKLTLLAINDNNLTGGIPPFLGNITSMEVFSSARNPLGGSIPDSLGNWKSLRAFECGDCNLYGTIPHFIYNLSLLANFSLPDNHLIGSLPSAMGAMLPHLVFLQLRTNQFTGFLPPSLSNCTKLRFLEMGGNNFRGKLTINFGKLSDIYKISLGNNLFGSGEADEMKFIDHLQNCSKLQILSINNCKLQGVIPTSIGNFSSQFSYLYLGDNQLYGNLPLSIGSIVSLTILSVPKNRITGKIPSTIVNLQNLHLVSLYENQILGPIPDAIGNLSLLTYLYLHSNRLEGYIPSSLGNCHHLLDMSLSNNKLHGEIPKQLFQLSYLSITLDLSQNNLYGSIPTQVGDLKMLTCLDLSHNNLSGNIPSSIGACTSLSFLYFQGNLFQGMIPSSLRFLRALVELDLSHNKLSGQIPRFFKQLSSIEYLNISFNDFEGQVPMLGVFANSSAFSVLGNSRLCGGLVELRLPKCKETTKRQKRFPLFVVVILIASTLFLVLCLVYVCCKKKRKATQPGSSSMNERFLNVSYSQLFSATNGFSPANLIGKGAFSSVYKGTLDHYDRVVAVKVIHLQNRGAHKSFIRECEALGSIRHRNLLRIVTLCSSVDFQGNDFKALVYEFMANGNLHDWLHSIVDRSRLTLLQRINILIDIACAVDYLHNQCTTTIIHGDLKPVNILLDDDMVAHVGDFGLAQLLGTNSNQSNSSGIRGTIGYAPPEYGVENKMTMSGDVYSFGILLLEVMMRKTPTDNIFNEGLTLHKFAYMALPDHVNDVIDDDLPHVNQENAQSSIGSAMEIGESLASIVKIGVSCSLDSPSQRMNIKNVVHELQGIQLTLHNVLGIDRRCPNQFQKN